MTSGLWDWLMLSAQKTVACVRFSEPMYVYMYVFTLLFEINFHFDKSCSSEFDPGF